MKLKYFLQVEYILVKFNDLEKTAKVSLRGEKYLSALQEKEHNDPKSVLKTHAISCLKLN